MSGWDFRVRGYASPNYARQIGCAPGALLVETTHNGESSAYVEIEAWLSRRRRGDVSKIELIDLRPGGNLTNLDIDLSTHIPWSWAKSANEQGGRK